MCRALAAAGADIVSLQIDQDKAVVEAAERHGRRGAVYTVDMRDPKAVSEVFPRILNDGWHPTIFISW